MATEDVKLPHKKCSKCGYETIPRVPNPIKCPRCGRPYKFEEKPK